MPSCSRTAAAVAVASSVLLWGTVGPAAAVTSGEFQKDAVSATNEERTSRGIEAVSAHKCLQKYAVKQARKQAAQERMFHQSLTPIMKKCGMNHVGENVAYGFDSGEEVVAAWMRSSGHRANILDSRFELIGFGARQADDGTWYVSQVFGRKG